MSKNDSKPLSQQMLDWIRYSGASISITVNPFHWFWTPRFFSETIGDWPGPNEYCGRISFLFLSVRFWIDDGSW